MRGRSGDIDALRQLTGDRRTDCISLLISAITSGQLTDQAVEKEQVQKVLEDAERGRKELAQQWLAAAEAALAAHRTTVAVLPMEQILRPDGYVAELRARGYAIEEP